MPRSILIADDSVTIRRVVELAFSDTDIRVEAAGGGNEALAKFSALTPDLVLADVVMPAPDGYEICRAVKSSDRPVPVLLLAGTFEPLDPQQAKLCGADGHLVKPFDSRLLVAQVAKLLGAGSTIPTGTMRAVPSPRPAAKTDDELEDMFDDLAGVPGAGREIASASAADTERTSESSAVTAKAARATAVAGLDAAAVEAIVSQVVARLSDQVVREIAWDVIPDLAETIIRERLRELERDDEVR